MDLIDVIRQAQGGHAIDNLARAFQIPPAEAEAAVEAVLPELSRGIERNTLSRGGVADLIEAMGSGRAERTMDNPAMFGNPAVVADGNGILKHILGPDKDSSRAAAQRASLSSGVSDSLIKLLLPYIAQLLMGALTKKTEGGLGDILSKIPGMPGSATPPAPQRGGASLPFPQPRQQPQTLPRNSQAGPSPSSSGPVSIDNQQPLPLPTGLPDDASGRNPYGDLSDIIRGGRPVGGGSAPSGGGLGNIIRDMLGGALGFPGRSGVMSWIVRAVLLRYGWSILRALFGSVLGGRR